NRELDEGMFAATADPRERSVPPPRQDPPPHLDFSPLANAVDSLARAADRYEKAFARAQASGTAFAQSGAAALNAILIHTVRAPPPLVSARSICVDAGGESSLAASRARARPPGVVPHTSIGSPSTHRP